MGCKQNWDVEKYFVGAMALGPCVGLIPHLGLELGTHPFLVRVLDWVTLLPGACPPLGASCIRTG